VLFSKRSLEGFLMIDHRNSPGLTEADVAPLRAAGYEVPAVGKGQVFKTPTMRCNHCHGTVVLNPNRTRPREHCSRCGEYVCDPCKALGTCVPMQQVIDHVREQAFRRANGYAPLPPLPRNRLTGGRE
jgi:hypothetical protein